MTKVDRKLFVVVDDNDEYQFASESDNGTLLRRGARLRYLPASLSYELPAPEPRFKKGDRIVFSESATSGVATVERVDNSVYKIRLPDGCVNYWNIGRIDASYELAPAEPKFKVGDPVRLTFGAEDLRRTVDVVEADGYWFKTPTGSRFWVDQPDAEVNYELVPVPSFVVGEMVLDTPSGQYAKVLHFSEPFDRVRVQVGYGTVYTRHPDALEKLA